MISDDDSKQIIKISPTPINEQYYSFDITVSNHNGDYKRYSIVVISPDTATATEICYSIREYIKRFEIPVYVHCTSEILLQPVFGKQIMLMMRSNNMRYQYVTHPSKKGDGEKVKKVLDK